MSLTLEEELKYRGITELPAIINPSDELLKTLELYSSLPISEAEREYNRMSLKEALYDAKKFLNYYYDLRKVNYAQTIRIIGKDIHIGRAVSPLKLPVRLYESGDVFSGNIETAIAKNGSIYFLAINLSNIVTEQTSTSYVHEVTHTQLEGRAGAINDYYNIEVLSIFNELFHASILDIDEKTLKVNDARRIFEMAITAATLRNFADGLCELSTREQLDCCKYLVSDLKAYNLFTLFYYGNDELKNDILDGVQAVFDGYLTVEELLEKFNITFENSQNNERVLSYFKR